jgi:hemerythrin-like domain-containing protein
MKDVNLPASSRRDFLAKAGACLGAAAVLGPASLAAAAPKTVKAEEVTPTEDLMREHGVLHRLLLIYDEVVLRLRALQEFPLSVLTGATGLVRRFVQDYHEKDEEKYLFTRFEKAGTMVSLVKVLYQQHQAGRKLTAALTELSTEANLQKSEERMKIAASLHSFTHMYRPHAAREDTVLYPAFRSVIPGADFNALGDTFEAKERKLFGKNGFEKIVAEVAGLEKQLGLYELARFTPRV